MPTASESLPAAKRQSNLPLLQNTGRILILPRGQLPKTASHFLAQFIHYLPLEWQRCHRSRPAFIKTFAEQEQPAGICLRAGNWIYIGQKQGRGELAVRSQFGRYLRRVTQVVRARPRRVPSGHPQAHGTEAGTGTQPDSTPPPRVRQPTRFHGTVELDATRTGPDASRVADEAIVHLFGPLATSVTVTLETKASVPDGVPQHVV